MLPCLIIADDLTGACDAGVHFARAGFETVVFFADRGLPIPECSIPVANTSTRSKSAAAAVKSVAEVLSGAPQCGILYKKIDSTFHGHIAAELESLMDAGSRKGAILTPAYPAMGRTVKGGVLSCGGRPQVRIADVLRARLTSLDTLDSAAAAHKGVYVADAESEEDLRRLAEASMPFRGRLILAGSGGFARELAPLLARECGIVPRPWDPLPRRDGPVAFFVGSQNPVTAEQVENLKRSRLPCVVRIVRLDAAHKPAAEWLRVCETARAIVFCGGESAQLVCSAFRMAALRLQGEVVPGLPWAYASGGDCDGMIIVTKAGGFGAPDALVRTARFLLAK